MYLHVSKTHTCTVYAGAYLGFSGCAILISATHVDAVVPSAAAVACIHISTQHTSNDVAQMGHVVHIGQGTCDENIPLPCIACVQTSALRNSR